MKAMRWMLALVLALGVNQLAEAQVKSGTAGAQFLKIGVSARGMALADAMLPMADDASALYYNPAGLTLLDGWQASFSHHAMWVDINQEWIGVAKGNPEDGSAWGVSVTYLNSGMMEETTPLRPLGTGREFDYQDFALGFSYARRLTNKFSAGITMKYLQESTMEIDATGWAADVGTYYDTGWRSLRMAMIISNFGPDMSFIEEEYPIPIMFRFGMAMDLYGVKTDDHFLAGTFEFGHPSDNVEFINVGLEYAFRDRFFLRMGKKMNAVSETEWEDYDPEAGYEYPLLSSDGLGVGAGFKFESSMGNFVFDYAYAPSRYLEGRNMITLSWSR
jgi:predicted porin